MRETKMLMKLLSYELFGVCEELCYQQLDWEQLLCLGEKHAVLALLYPGVKRLSDVPAFVLEKLRSAAILSAINVEKMTKLQNEIIEGMNKNNIDIAVLKGSSVSVLYPHPELRLQGDIDLLINPVTQVSAENVLEKLGFQCYDRRSAHHICFEKDHVIIELHCAISRFGKAKKAQLCAEYLRNCMQDRVTLYLGESLFCALDCRHQAVALLKHMDSHLRNSELRLRQICDWALFVKNNQTIFDSFFLQRLDDFGLLVFAKVVTQACVSFLQLPKQNWCGRISDTLVSDFLKEIIFSAVQNQRSATQGATFFLTTDSGEKSNQKFLLKTYIQRCNLVARRDYSRIAKNKILLPFFWIFFPLRYIIHTLQGKREKIDYQLLFSTVSRRENLLERLKLFE